MMTPIVVIIRACARYKGDEDDESFCSLCDLRKRAYSITL